MDTQDKKNIEDQAIALVCDLVMLSLLTDPDTSRASILQTLIDAAHETLADHAAVSDEDFGDLKFVSRDEHGDVVYLTRFDTRIEVSAGGL